MQNISHTESHESHVWFCRSLFGGEHLLMDLDDLDLLEWLIFRTWHCFIPYDFLNLNGNSSTYPLVLTVCFRKSPFVIVKSTISMAILNSFLYLYQRVTEPPKHPQTEGPVAQAFGIAFEGRTHKGPVLTQRVHRVLQCAGVEFAGIEDEARLGPERVLQYAKNGGLTNNTWG